MWIPWLDCFHLEQQPHCFRGHSPSDADSCPGGIFQLLYEEWELAEALQCLSSFLTGERGGILRNSYTACPRLQDGSCTVDATIYFSGMDYLGSSGPLSSQCFHLLSDWMNELRGLKYALPPILSSSCRSREGEKLDDLKTIDQNLWLGRWDKKDFITIPSSTLCM